MKFSETFNEDIKLEVSVAVPGPPLVRTNTVSIILEASINRIMMAPIDIGAIKGNVTYINFLKGLAPSMEAAKKGSFGSSIIQQAVVKT